MRKVISNYRFKKRVGLRMKTALICGISGQDGSYLAQLLLNKGYQVIGTSRDADISGFENLKRLGIRDRVSTRSMSLMDFRSITQVLTESDPDEIYNLSGQSSVGLSFLQPTQTLESIALATLNLLEATRLLNKKLRLYNAASSECFGEVGASSPATETTPFRPRSPYGIAKAAAFWEVANYREAYGNFAVSGILFNHESSLRPARFVTRKIVQTVCRIAGGSDERLPLGNLDISRDWGWAPEYVEAMWLMLQTDEPTDYLVATGESHTLGEFVAACFEAVGLDYRLYVDINRALFRVTEIQSSHGNPSKAERDLNWRARTTMKELVRKLVDEERLRT
jgi:GDPmannose 4,6-dehydratase